MVVKVQGRSLMPPTSYLFIDAENLRLMLSDLSSDYGGDGNPEINWERVRGSYKKVFYYDALPPKRGEQSDADYRLSVELKQRQLHDIEKKDRFHVKSGVTRHRRRRGNEQKMVDILLAVDALTMANRGLFESASIVTSDLDFEPLIKELVNIGIDVTLIHDRNGTNDELCSAADVATPLTIDFVRGQLWIDPAKEGLTIPDLSPIERSQTWTRCVVINEFQSDEHGNVRFGTIDGNYTVECDRAAGFNSEYRIKITSTSEAALRAYALDRLNLRLDFARGPSD